MEDFTLQKHNFEKAKAKILALSEKVPPKVSLNKFQTEGDWIPWHDHKVTGEEINNDLVIPLQKTIGSIKTSLKNLFDISSEVYRTFDYLDKDYIQGIIAAIDSAKTASNQAKTASDKAEVASNRALDASAEALEVSKKATKAQEENSIMIDALQATVKGLKDFKESTIKRLDSLDSLLQGIKNNEIIRLDTDLSAIQQQIRSFAHTNDVDAIKNDVLANKAFLSDVHQQISDLSSITAATTKKIHADLAVLQQFHSLLESYTHLVDVDATWEDVQTHKIDLSGLHEQINEITSKATETTEKIHADLAVLQQFQTLLQSNTHLVDVDTTWEDVQTHKTDLSGLHQQINEITSKATETTEKIHADLAVLQQFHSLLESYTHLVDVDATWEDVQTHKSDLSGLHEQINEITSKATETTGKIHADLAVLQQFQTLLESYTHLVDVDATWEDVQAHKTDLSGLHEQIREIDEDGKQREEALNKKMIITYSLAGGSLALTIIHLVLRLMDIL